MNYPKLNALSPQKRIFVMEYLKDFKPSKAAQRVGLAANTGSQWLGLPEIQEAIEEQMDERMARTEIDADWVLKQLAEMFNADFGDIVDGDGRFLPIHEWPPVWRKMVSSVKVLEQYMGKGADREFIGFVKEIKHIDKLAAIKAIGQHTNVKAFTERLEISSEQDLIDRLTAGRKRARMKNQDDEELNFLGG